MYGCLSSKKNFHSLYGLLDRLKQISKQVYVFFNDFFLIPSYLDRFMIGLMKQLSEWAWIPNAFNMFDKATYNE